MYCVYECVVNVSLISVVESAVLNVYFIVASCNLQEQTVMRIVRKRVLVVLWCRAYHLLIQMSE